MAKHWVDLIGEVEAGSFKELELDLARWDWDEPWPYLKAGIPNVPDEVFELSQLESLNLAGLGMTELSPKIHQLRNLKHLILTGNQLKSLPEDIAQLQNLVSLEIGRNPLDSLPKWISRLPNLTGLSFGPRWAAVPEWIAEMSNLTDLGLICGVPIPDWIVKMSWLQSLNIGGNDLTSLPEAVFRLESLKVLTADGNQLTTLPDSISQLQNLSRLSLSVNRLNELPDAIGELLNLTTLNAAGNRLSSLPRSFSRLRNLSSLRLGNNNFVTVPECLYALRELQHLSLANFDRWGWHYTMQTGKFSETNSVERLSPELLRLIKLTDLDVRNNPIGVPPPEVLAKGLSAIQDYFRQIDIQGVDHLYEAKLLILGEGGAGKTTLAKKIQNPDYCLEEETSTQGIDIFRWTFPLDNGKDFRVNIWDFGGQEIYHATHQFFLTKRSLYVLVADTRKEDTDFYYWLNILELLSDNSPVLIVKNEKQDRHREISERQLRGQFDALKETLATNFATNRGLSEILKSIRYYIANLQHVGSPLPKTWVKVREVLEQHSKNYISVELYLEICETNGFSNTKDKLQLSGYLHDLGVCLHFQEDPVLKKLVILKPKWGTDAVYKILDNRNIIAALGHFTRDDLTGIWNEPEYENMHEELLRLMINFKLCYQIPGSTGRYIAPQLLTENQPSYQWDAVDNLVFKYRYEFMPKGIVTQFIVAIHPLIAGPGCVWKSGVILEKDKTRAEIVEHYGKREVQVRISGRHKRDLMAIVIYELDKIHSGYRQLRYARLVPCKCERCRVGPEPMFYSLEVLRKFMEDRQTQIQCQSSYQMVDVRGLLDNAGDLHSASTEVDRGTVVFNAPITTVVIQRTEDKVMHMERKPTDDIKSAWANGLFYLLTFVTVIVGLAFVAGHIALYGLAVVVVAGMLFILVIGALQLRQDGRLSEKSFIQLVSAVIRQLPIIGRFAKSGSETDSVRPS